MVVAVNSDKSAEALKGKGQPVIPCAERMEMLSGLWFVDYVTTFDEEDAEELLRQLHPSMYAKGTDYTLKTLPEKAVLKELEVKAVFVGGKKDHSTSKLLATVGKLKKK